MCLLAYLDFAFGPILTNKGTPLPLVNTFNGIANSRLGFFLKAFLYSIYCLVLKAGILKQVK